MEPRAMSMATIGEVDRFRTAIEGRLGLRFEDDKTEWLAEVLQERLQRRRMDGDSYLHRLAEGRDIEEWRALGSALTVSESYFFRHREQFEAFAEAALPARLAARARERRLAVLSAGCASGEEPYTLAMLLRQAATAGWQVELTAVDLNPAMIERAQRGRYTAWALRETDAAMRGRWFQPVGTEYQLDAAIRDAVRFDVANLVADDLWRPAHYDIVFCRNVLMYFAPEQARRVVGHIARALAPGGYLFMGHAETLRGLSREFQLCHTHRSFYYRLGFAEAAETRAFPREPEFERGLHWMENIERASERVRALVTRARSAVPAKRNWDAGPARELMRQERYADALEHLRALPMSAQQDGELLRLRAMLLLHAGWLSEAQSVCRELLAHDRCDAAAHFVLGLCHEGAEEIVDAMTHHRAATHCDPAFAMPHLHLGLLARRMGDIDDARRELAHALALLQYEDEGRLAVYGGGFAREALLALCRAELRACGA